MSVTSAANIEVQPIWATLFASALKGKSVGDYLMALGSASSSAVPVAVAATTAAESKAAPAADKKPAAQKEESESEDGGMGGLFD